MYAINPPRPIRVRMCLIAIDENDKKAGRALLKGNKGVKFNSLTNTDGRMRKVG